MSPHCCAGKPGTTPLTMKAPVPGALCGGVTRRCALRSSKSPTPPCRGFPPPSTPSPNTPPVFGQLQAGVFGIVSSIPSVHVWDACGCAASSRWLPLSSTHSPGNHPLSPEPIAVPSHQPLVSWRKRTRTRWPTNRRSSCGRRGWCDFTTSAVPSPPSGIAPAACPAGSNPPSTPLRGLCPW
jgi:hypothetical protein